MNIQLHLNSANADEYGGPIPYMNSVLTWHLKRFVPTRLDRRQTMYISVMSASIPCTFLNCDYYNNQFVYIDMNNVEHTITIPQGNYNVATMGKWINDTTPFTVTYNSITNHYEFTKDDSMPWTWSTKSTCGELFGLSVESGNIQSDPVGKIESDIAINFFTIRNIVILCPSIITNNVNAQQQTNRNCLLSIPVTAGANSMLIYQNTANIRSELDSYNQMTNFQLALVDQDGDYIDLNGAHWSISLLFQIE